MSDEDNEKKGPSVLVIGTGAANAALLAALAGDRRPREFPAAADPVSAEPLMKSDHGRAWQIDMDQMRRTFGESRTDATVAVWIVEAEWAHPIWHSYAVILVHLRPHPSFPAPKLNRPDATHEFWVFAMDPAQPRDPQIAGTVAKLGYLTPMNFGAQLACGHDAAAMELIEAAVRDIVAARISPDTDHFGAWVDRFGESLVRPEYRR